jgi:hypothetical protein
MNNRSQLEELRMSRKELWMKGHGIKDYHSHVAGAETPLGHAYSVILEELAVQGLDATPKPDTFIDFMKVELMSRGMSHKVGEVNMLEKSWCPIYSDAILSYMRTCELSPSSCAKMMAEIVGPDVSRYSEVHLKRK